MMRRQLADARFSTRLLWTLGLGLGLFLLATILSYYVLPEGFMLGRNRLTDFAESTDTRMLGLQIFLFNGISVVAIWIASLFAVKRAGQDHYLSVGYTVLFVLFVINAVTLGTWSFTSAGAAVPLTERITGLFDLTHRAALWEMTGQMVITAALAGIYRYRIQGKVLDRTGRRITWREMRWVLVGLALMAIGAFLEAAAIGAVS